MRVLVTGGAGYIGSHAVLSLKDAGLAPIVLDDLSTGVAAAVPDDTRLIPGDVGDRVLVEQIIRQYRIEAVLHFAGSTVVPQSVADPLWYYRNNTVNSHALIETCVGLGVRRFIFSSTAAVYGVPDALPIGETAPTRPASPYGWSKLMVEQILRDTARAHDFRFVALRYFNVAGADPLGRSGQRTANATHLVKVACEAALGLRPTLRIFGDRHPTADGTGVRDYIHVSDLAEAHLGALRYLADGGASCVLNCGYGRGYSVREVVAAVERAAGAALPVEIVPPRPGDVPAAVAGADRIREVLRWRPRHDDLDLIVRSALDWERRGVGE